MTQALSAVGGEARLGQRDELVVGAAGVKTRPRVSQPAFLGVLERRRRVPGVRGLAGQDLAQDRAERKDVGPLVELVDLAPRLLGRHVGGRAHDRARERMRPHRFGLGEPDLGLAGGLVARLPVRVVPRQQLRQPPVHDLGLAELGDHDVGGFEIPVDHAAGVRVGHGLAHALEDGQEPAAVLVRRAAIAEQHRQGRALDEPHREIGAPIRLKAQLVDREDPRVLKLPGDLGLLDEAAHHRLVVGVPGPEDLHGHVAAEVGVVAPDDDAHPPAGDLAQRLVAGAAGAALRGPFAAGRVVGTGLAAQQDPRFRPDPPLDLGQDTQAGAGVRATLHPAEAGLKPYIQPALVRFQLGLTAL